MEAGIAGEAFEIVKDPWMSGGNTYVSSITAVGTPSSFNIGIHCPAISPSLLSRIALLSYLDAQPSENYVVNDLNSEIINLFRVLQRHYPQFMDCLKYQITSRREFERLRATDPATLTDLERAGRFLYLQRLAFGGQVNGVFGVAKERPARFDINRLGPILEEVHERLAGVVFENLPWHEFIVRYDTPKTLFYLDPPYFGGEKDYGKDIFAPEDFQKIADVLGALKGEFVLSINDTPEIREIFGQFNLDEVRLTYTIAKGETGGKARELIFSNATVVAGLI